MKTMKQYETPSARRIDVVTAGIIATSVDKKDEENVDGSDKTRHGSSLSDYSSDIWGNTEE